MAEAQGCVDVEVIPRTTAAAPAEETPEAEQSVEKHGARAFWKRQDLAALLGEMLGSQNLEAFLGTCRLPEATKEAYCFGASRKGLWLTGPVSEVALRRHIPPSVDQLKLYAHGFSGPFGPLEDLQRLTDMDLVLVSIQTRDSKWLATARHLKALRLWLLGSQVPELPSQLERLMVMTDGGEKEEKFAEALVQQLEAAKDTLKELSLLGEMRSDSVVESLCPLISCCALTKLQILHSGKGFDLRLSDASAETLLRSLPPGLTDLYLDLRWSTLDGALARQLRELLPKQLSRLRLRLAGSAHGVFSFLADGFPAPRGRLDLESVHIDTGDADRLFQLLQNLENCKLTLFFAALLVSSRLCFLDKERFKIWFGNHPHRYF